MLCKLQTHRTDKFVVIHPARLEGAGVLYRNLVASFLYIKKIPLGTLQTCLHLQKKSSDKSLFT